MHKRATWVVGGFVALVVIAAALDAVFFRRHSAASTRGTTSEESDVAGTRSDRSSAAPPCRSSQLKLTINRGTPQNPPRHGDYVTLTHVRGGACRFSGRLKRLLIFAPKGLAGGVEEDHGGRFAGVYEATSGRHILQFRYSPGCKTAGPYIAEAQVGDYVARAKIRVYRCGIEPPPFQ